MTNDCEGRPAAQDYRARLLAYAADHLVWTRARLRRDLFPPEELLVALLCLSHRTGPHNLGRRGAWLRSLHSGHHSYARIAISDDRTATTDHDALARLVIGAHDAACRISVQTCNPLRLYVFLHIREREGGISERHPTLEDAAASMRAQVLG